MAVLPGVSGSHMVTWKTTPPAQSDDGAVYILVHDTASDEYSGVYVLWQEDPIKYHVPEQNKVLDHWPSTWKWAPVED